MKQIYLHIVGEATIGAGKGESLTEAIDRFRSDPLFVPPWSREASAHGEWALPLTKIAQREVSTLVLVVTAQTPPHDKDTWPIADELVDGSIDQIWAAEGKQTPDIRTLRVSDFSVSGFMTGTTDLIRSLALAETDEIQIEMGAGATSAFVGVVLGVLQAGVVPRVVQLNTDPIIEIDLVKGVSRHLDFSAWLARHRLWNELADDSTIEADLKQRLVAQADFESLRRGPDPRQALNFVYSDIVGRIARDDQTFLPKFQRLAELVWRRLMAGVDKPTTRLINEILRREWTGCVDLRDAVDRDFPDNLYSAAKSNDKRWRACSEHLPSEVVQFWNEFGRPLRNLHVHTDHERLSRKDYEATKPEAVRHLVEFVGHLEAVGVGLLITDQIPRGVTRIAEPIRLGAPSAVKIRNIGKSEKPVLKAAFDRHEVGVPDVVVVEYAPKSPDDPRLFLDFDVALDSFVERLEESIRAEEERGTSVRSAVVYLNQGSKAMNLAVVCGSLAVAFQYGLELDVVELAENLLDEQDSTTVVRSTSRVESERVLGRLLPTDQVSRATATALTRLDVELASRLAQYLPASQRNAVDGVSDFFKGTGGKSRFERAAKSVARSSLVVQQSPVIGPAESVIMISQFLSGNFRASDDDPWRHNLGGLWNERNRAIHLRNDSTGRIKLPTLPTTLTVDALADSLSDPCGFESDKFRSECRRYEVLLKDRFAAALRSLRPVFTPVH